ncbi:hypothetical protein C7B82_05100 [Stenomitos frigidus ULC18]|uniref:Uncharacterized protein n=1 Tax=Stenomitos frigidus ULC18 TaxID=2107698 RepID=A0A2T1EIP5_9CYAN|nr:hypothetical protein C7B82_05100 [Stenomitos frigidus ULC18]
MAYFCHLLLAGRVDSIIDDLTGGLKSATSRSVITVPATSDLPLREAATKGDCQRKVAGKSSRIS